MIKAVRAGELEGSNRMPKEPLYFFDLDTVIQ